MSRKKTKVQCHDAMFGRPTKLGRWGCIVNQDMSPASKTVLTGKLLENKALPVLTHSPTTGIHSPGGGTYSQKFSVGPVDFALRGHDPVEDETFLAQGESLSTERIFSFIEEQARSLKKLERSTSLYPGKKIKKQKSRSQAKYFENKSANEVARELGLEGEFEYLHLLAHSYDGLEAQCKDNLVLGSKASNTVMMFVEKAAQRLKSEGFRVNVYAVATIDITPDQDNKHLLREKYHLAEDITYTMEAFSSTCKRVAHLKFNFDPKNHTVPPYVTDEAVASLVAAAKDKSGERVGVRTPVRPKKYFISAEQSPSKFKPIKTARRSARLASKENRFN